MLRKRLRLDAIIVNGENAMKSGLGISPENITRLNGLEVLAVTSGNHVWENKLDGKVSAVIGTHTHIQTADEQILPDGTGFITDAGSCRALNSVVGFESKGSIAKFLYHHKEGGFSVESKGEMVFCAVFIEVDVETGKTVRINRIREVVGL